MGIPWEVKKDMWVSHTKGGKQPFLIASPDKEANLIAEKCSNDGVRAGLMAASIASLASVVPMLMAVRMIPGAKAILDNPTQAFIMSIASIIAYFPTDYKTMSECARKNGLLEDSLRNHK